jgi:hypothetical protein
MASSVVTQVIVLPGSGCTPTRDCNFYKWFGDTIDKTGKYKTTMENMPDPHVCREQTWIPFINDRLGGSNPECVVVGHSSGAVAALRLAGRAVALPLPGVTRLVTWTLTAVTNCVLSRALPGLHLLPGVTRLVTWTLYRLSSIECVLTLQYKTTRVKSATLELYSRRGRS